MHRFAGPIRVIERLAMFDKMHRSIHDVDSRPSFKVPSVLLVSVCCPSLKHIDEKFELVDMICTSYRQTGAVYA